jgi:hypothetical protein
MPNQTGTFVDSTDLLNKLNTFLVANSWTKLEGETDLNCASPKAARYWRVLVLDTSNPTANYRELNQMEWRSSTGGANVALTASNYSFSSVGTAGDLVAGVTVTSTYVDENIWWLKYDFVTPTEIHEIVMKSALGSSAFSRFYVQWSNDNKVWTTMKKYEGITWVDNETKTFTWDTGTGYVDSYHTSGTQARRSGYSDVMIGQVFTKFTEWCDNVWTWQGPGYDAARRVYFSSSNWSDPVAGVDHIRFTPHTAYDSTIPRVTWFQDQEGVPPADSFLVVDSSGGTYWFYVNSTRVVVVTKSGISDYSSVYVGFMAAFAQPDDYPFPLYVGATTDDINETLSSSNADVRDCVDPGDGWKAKFRSWDNTWNSVENHNGAAGSINDPIFNPVSYTWPYHIGQAGRGTWPNNVIGDHVDWDAHWLDRIEPTEQGDLPFIPVIVMNRPAGSVGALDGIFCVPRGNVLSPEQVITISATNYRIFSTRSKTGGMNFYAVRED